MNDEYVEVMENAELKDANDGSEKARAFGAKFGQKIKNGAKYVGAFLLGVFVGHKASSFTRRDYSNYGNELTENEMTMASDDSTMGSE